MEVTVRWLASAQTRAADERAKGAMNRGGVACAVARRSYKGVVCVRVRGHRNSDDHADADADMKVDGAELSLAGRG